MAYTLPKRLPSYLVRLSLQYARTNPDLAEIITTCKYAVVEETAYDNWNGGQRGHDLLLYVPIDALAKIDVDAQLEAANTISEDLRKLAAGIDAEFLNRVAIEMENEEDPDFQRAIPFSGRPTVSPDSLSIWKPGMIRVFISHRDAHKAKAHELAEALEPYGYSCFVAHDNIPANEEWRQVIVNGLETMEIMLLFVTDDFSGSYWTMQEVGYALGKAIPCVSLKLESHDPPGFVSHTQALRGKLEQPQASVPHLAPLLAKALGKQDRFQSALIASFNATPDWGEARIRFDRMAKAITKLNDAEVAAIVEGFRRNDQLHNSGYLTHKANYRIKDFLRAATGEEYIVRGAIIEPAF